jgi:hypothetical protein
VSESAHPRPLLVSAVSTNLPELRAHWRQASSNRDRPLQILGGTSKPAVDLGGALLRTGSARVVTMAMPAAMERDGDSLLVTSPWAVHRLSATLDIVDSLVWDLPVLNAVHWLARSEAGWLVVCSGLDLIIEVDALGRIAWEWWAIDHGYETDPLGRRRTIDRTIDHRGIDYGTISSTTHVNSACELPDGSIAATLFHRGELVRIARNGSIETLLAGLDHPHAVRRLADGRLSLVDTGNGRVLLVDPEAEPGPAFEVRGIPGVGRWLQDARWEEPPGQWVLVDGEGSRTMCIPGRTPEAVCVADATVEQHQVDWRLYGALTDPWHEAQG